MIDDHQDGYINMMQIERELTIQGQLKFNEPMSRHTSWRVGGVADRYFLPADIDDLCCFMKQLPDHESVFWLGLGSNLLVRDGGIRGTVLAIMPALSDLEIRDAHCIHVGAGVPCAKVARFIAQSGFSGGEFLAGIPGTMGGALAMNAGAFGGETWGLVKFVEMLGRSGRRYIRSAQDFDIGYRRVDRPDNEWFVSVDLLLPEGSTNEDAKQRISRSLKQRSASQPIGQASCGSVFLNPIGDYAARLIEASGLKGQCIGDACVSEKHANFIINQGGYASAADIEALIDYVQAEVQRVHGVRLVPEVKIVGSKQDR